MKVTINTEVKGKRPVNLNALNKAFEQFDTMEIDITIEKHKKKRTNPQNAYWFGVVVPMVQMGIMQHGTLVTSEQTHEMLKGEFLEFDVPISDDGQFVTMTKGTSDLDTVEFNTLIGQVQQWSAEMLGIIIPDPNEQITIEA